MSGRWEALFGLVSAAILFLPIFVAIFSATDWRQRTKVAQARRIAAYRRSPESRLLILTD